MNAKGRCILKHLQQEKTEAVEKQEQILAHVRKKSKRREGTTALIVLLVISYGKSFYQERCLLASLGCLFKPAELQAAMCGKASNHVIIEFVSKIHNTVMKLEEEIVSSCVTRLGCSTASESDIHAE